MDKKEVADKYCSYLADEGFRPTIDPDGDVIFKKEGLIYILIIDPQDETSLRVVSPNLWPIENEEERSRVLRACDVANAGTKSAKMYTVRDNVWANIEIFVTAAEAYKQLLPRLLNAMQFATNMFTKEMSTPAQATSSGSAAPQVPAAPQSQP